MNTQFQLNFTFDSTVVLCSNSQHSECSFRQQQRLNAMVKWTIYIHTYRTYMHSQSPSFNVRVMMLVRGTGRLCSLSAIGVYMVHSVYIQHSLNKQRIVQLQPPTTSYLTSTYTHPYGVSVPSPTVSLARTTLCIYSTDAVCRRRMKYKS